MRAETIRRLLVFGVCAVGVTALYLVPGVSRPVATQPRDDRPHSIPTLASEASITPRPVSLPTTAEPASSSAGSDSTVDDAPAPDDQPTRSDDDPAPERTAGTAFNADPGRDQIPPAQVSSIKLERATPDEATISWPEADDDRGVIVYKVSLNGFVVETTAKTSATVHWFNDDSVQQIVQVRAVDGAGNESRQAASLLARRPAPSLSLTPTPSTRPSTSASADAPSSSSPIPSADSAPTKSPEPKSDQLADGAGPTTTPVLVETPG